VPVLVSVTLALGTKPPEGSVTVPVTTPRPDCPSNSEDADRNVTRSFLTSVK